MPLITTLPNETDSPCALLLRDGLYEYFGIQRSVNFTEDMRTYLQSDKFIEDLNSLKWGGSYELNSRWRSYEL